MRSTGLSVLLATAMGLAFVPAGPLQANPLSWDSLAIDTSAGTILANGVDLVAGGYCTLTTAPASVAGYNDVARYTLSASYLAGYDGISIDAQPALSGSRGLALEVPGSITINAAWEQSGGSGVYGVAGAAGVGGFRGGVAKAQYNGENGFGPGGGNTGGAEREGGAGGSLVSAGGSSNGAGPTVPEGFPAHPGSSADLWGGSGGGSNNPVNSTLCGGGGGGGAVGFFSTDPYGSITVTAAGSIHVNGGAGKKDTYGSGGAGSGGTIILASGGGGAVTLEGPLSADGGEAPLAGGSYPGRRSGGAGAGGEIAVYYGTGLNEFVAPTVAPGNSYNNSYTTPATAGHYYTEALPPVAAHFHPGDANGDGVVDLQDFGALKDHFGRTEGASWATGDFNADGAIDLQDFGVLKDHFGHSAGDTPLSAVPEPACAALLALAAASLRGRRRPPQPAR